MADATQQKLSPLAMLRGPEQARKSIEALRLTIQQVIPNNADNLKLISDMHAIMDVAHVGVNVMEQMFAEDEEQPEEKSDAEA